MYVFASFIRVSCTDHVRLSICRLLSGLHTLGACRITKHNFAAAHDIHSDAGVLFSSQTYSKYFPADPDVEDWDRQFEGLWGYRVAVVAHHWRETQKKQRIQIGRTYPVEGVPQREAPPAFVVSESESSPSSQAASLRSQPSSARSSPREQHSGVEHGHNGSNAGAGVGQRQQRPTAGSAKARNLQAQQSLPSLKASGLLDSWKPPAESFAHAVSVQRENGAGNNNGHAHTHSLGRNASGAVPVGLKWLNGPQ